MNHERRTKTMLLLVLGMCGCVLPDAKLGGGAESTDDGGDGTVDSSDPVTDPSTTTTTTDAGLPGVGAACDHHWPEGDFIESKLLTFPSPDCEGDICLYAPIDEAPADPCTTDEECNASNPGLARFTCVLPVGNCELDWDYIAERSMCSAFCEDASDCVTDETTNCETGFSCEPMSTLGDSCCRPVCVCNDDLDASTTHQIRESCENGTAPWCCEELPGNGLCPD